MTPAAILSIMVQAKGIAKTSSQLDQLDASVKKVDDSVNRSGKTLETWQVHSKRTADATDNLNKKFSNLDSTVGDFNRAMTATGHVVQLVKFPALIAGAGMAAQAVGALAAGGISLASALAPLVGLGAAVGAGYVAVRQGVGVAKLAFMGLRPALKGTKGAMDKLTPAQKTFVENLKASKKELNSFKQTAASGLLPGLSKALTDVMPLLSRIRPIVAGTAKEMANLAVSGAKTVRAWGPDLTAVGQLNIKVLHNLGMAAIALGTAAKDIVVAGGPLLLWMTKLGRTAAVWIQQQVQAGRESGRLAGFLDQTKNVMSTLIHIAANLGVALFNIGKAAAPLGRFLLAQIEQLTAKFRGWTESLQGRQSLAQYFRDARAPVMQMAGLVGDLGKALLQLSQPGKQSTGLIVQLRSLVPLIQNVLATTTASLGPALIDALGNILRVFASLAGTSGPLVLMVKLIGAIAGVLASLLQNNPALNTMAVSMFGLYGAVKALSVVFGPLAAIVGRTIVALLGEETAANSAGLANLRLRVSLVASAIAMQVQAAASRVAAAAMWLFNAALTANPIGIVIVGLAALTAALVIAYTKSVTFRNIVNGAWETLKNAATAVFPIIRKMMEYGLLGPIALIIAHWTTAKNVISGIWNTLKVIATSTFSAIRTVTVTEWTLIRDAVLNPMRTARDLIPGIVAGIKNALVSGMQAALSALRALGSSFIDFGRGVVAHIMDGIRGAGKIIADAIDWLKNKLIDTIKGLFGIHSPSSVFYDLGLNMMRGLINGITSADVAGFLKKHISSIVGDAGSLLGSVFGGAPSGSTGVLGRGTVNAGGGTSGSNQALAKRMMLAAGWPASQWPSLRSLWMQESGFSTTATNPTSGAYGIPQSLPASKMAAAGADWRTNPATQIRWGLGYIRSTYGSPSAAWSFDVAHGMQGYAGGASGAKKGWGVVGELGPEMVLFKGGEQIVPNHQLSSYAKGAGKKKPPKKPLKAGKVKVGKAVTQGRPVFGVPLHQGKIPQLDLKVAEAALTGTMSDDLTAAQSYIRYWTIAAVKAAFSGDTKAKTEALTQLKQWQDTAQSIQDQSPARDLNDAQIAAAQTTQSLADDIGPLRTRVDLLTQAYDASVKKFGSGSIQAAKAFADLSQATSDLAKTQRDAIVQGFQTQLTAGEAALTIAKVRTPGDLSDDLQALTGELNTATAAFNDAVARNDPEAINEFGGQVLSLRDAITQLNGSIEQNTQALLDLQKQQTANYQNLYNVSQSNYGILAKAIADVASGQIGGRVGLGFMTPGFAGSGGVRY